MEQTRNHPEYQREIGLVFGKTGMGKSNYLKGYLTTLRRAIVLDPLDEYPAVEIPDMETMFDHVTSNETFRVKSTNIMDLEIMGEMVDSIPDVTFIIEEAQRCLPPSRTDLPESIQRIIFQGRHFGRSLVIAAQRPSIVHIAARSQWTRICSFNLTEVNDVKWLEGTSGYSLDDEPDIRKLTVGTYLEITPGSLEQKLAPLYVPKKSKQEGGGAYRLENIFSQFSISGVNP